MLFLDRYLHHEPLSPSWYFGLWRYLNLYVGTIVSNENTAVKTEVVSSSETLVWMISEGGSVLGRQ
jgi:hypothetical protein